MTVHSSVCVLVIRVVACDRFLMTSCGKGDRLRQTPYSSISASLCPAHPLAVFHTLFLPLVDHVVCTVTCRQFPNLTFAPRKTCHEGSNLTLHRYHATATPIIHGLWQKCKNFFTFFIQTEISYVYPGNSSTKNRPDFRLRSAQWELLQCCESFPL